MEFPDIQSFMGALSSQHWPLVAALGMMLVVWVLRNVVKDRLPKKYVPYLTLAIAVLTSASTRIVQQIESNHTWWHGLIQGVLEGLTIGFVSMGMWSAGGKKLPTHQPREETEQEESEPSS